MLGKLLDRQLEQVELVGVEWIKSAELIAAPPPVQVDRVVAETVERLEIVLFAIVDVGQHLRLLLMFGEESFLDHFPHVSTGKGKLRLEPAHDLGDVLGLHAFE